MRANVDSNSPLGLALCVAIAETIGTAFTDAGSVSTSVAPITEPARVTARCVQVFPMALAREGGTRNCREKTLTVGIALMSPLPQDAGDEAEELAACVGMLEAFCEHLDGTRYATLSATVSGANVDTYCEPDWRAGAGVYLGLVTATVRSFGP